MDFVDGLDIQFNSEGWGPMGEGALAFDDIPYAHFDKKDKCWRHADFSQGQNQKVQYGRHRRGEDGRDGNAEFSFKHDAAEDSTFKLVDTSKTQSRPKHARRTWQSQPRGGMAGRGGGRFGGRGDAGNPQGGRGSKSKMNARGGRGGGRGGRWNSSRKVDRAPSLAVRGDWDMVEEIDLSQLSKLQVNQPKVEDLLWCGHVDQYDESYDKATSKAPRPLRPMENKRFYSVTTSDDHIMDKFAVEGLGNVFATDAILSQLMAASRSVYSWDLVIQKVNGMLFLDKRENSLFDFLTVSETANEAPTAADDVDEINFPDNLSLEATRINQNMSQQIVRQDGSGRKTVSFCDVADIFPF
jgi:translation initiation factor 3 subunit D